jgi:hypothetical protein
MDRTFSYCRLTLTRTYRPLAALLLLCTLCCSPVLAQKASDERVALVIGNADYRFSPLTNPKNDAVGMADLLTQAGFQVSRNLNVDRASLKAAVEQFGKQLKSPSVKFAIFYYAGHGVQLDWRNYLIPVDANVRSAEDVKAQSVDVSELLRFMDQAKDKSFLVILDACRDDPFGGSYKASNKGLSQFDGPVGSLLAYSTSPGNVAMDGSGNNGLYTSHLLRELSVRNAKLEDAFKRVRLNVRLESGGKQIPWESTSLEEDIYLFRSEAKKLSESEQETLIEKEVSAWRKIKTNTDPKVLAQFIREFPSGSTSELAQSRLNRLLAGLSSKKAEADTKAEAQAAADRAAKAAAAAALAAQVAQAQAAQAAKAAAAEQAAQAAQIAQAARAAAAEQAAQAAKVAQAAQAEKTAREASARAEALRVAEVHAQQIKREQEQAAQAEAQRQENFRIARAQRLQHMQEAELLDRQKLAQEAALAASTATRLESERLAALAARKQADARLAAEREAAAQLARAEEQRKQEALRLEQARTEEARRVTEQLAALKLAGEKARLAEQQEAQRLALLQQEAARVAAQQEAARVVAQQEAARLAAQEAARLATVQREADAARLAAAAPAVLLASADAASASGVTLAATPFYLGSNLFARQYAPGDDFGYRVIDRANHNEKPLNMRVTSVDLENERVEFNDGEYSSDLMGNITRNLRGNLDQPRQFYPAELYIGKRWKTQFKQTRPSGTVYTFKYDLKVVAKETVTVPAGRFETYKIEARGFNMEIGANLQRNIWVAAGIHADIVHETFVRLRNGRIDQDDRQELVRYVVPGNRMASSVN